MADVNSGPGYQIGGDPTDAVHRYEEAERAHRRHRRLHPFAEGVSDDDMLFAGVLGCAALCAVGVGTVLYGVARLVLRVWR